MITKKKKFLWCYGLCFAAALGLMLFLSNREPAFLPMEESGAFKTEFIKGQITSIAKPDENGDTPLKVEIMLKNRMKKTLEAPASGMSNFNAYKKGDRVQVYKMTNMETGEVRYDTADFDHHDGLWGMLLIFGGITWLTAKRKGILAMASVAVSLVFFYGIFLKMVTLGYSPLIACLVFVLISTALTIPLIHGFNRKSASALIAIGTGYALSILITIGFKAMAQLGNAPGEDFRTLGTMFPSVNLSDIVTASIFMGAVGALIDTAVTIASAVFEGVKKQNDHTLRHIYRIGMEVGKDILGTMTNTLLFAYLASALPFLVLLSLNKGGTLGELANMDFIALELTRTFTGALSLVLLIPIAAMASAVLFIKKPTQN